MLHHPNIILLQLIIWHKHPFQIPLNTYTQFFNFHPHFLHQFIMHHIVWNPTLDLSAILVWHSNHLMVYTNQFFSDSSSHPSTSWSLSHPSNQQVTFITNEMHISSSELNPWFNSGTIPRIQPITTRTLTLMPHHTISHSH